MPDCSSVPTKTRTGNLMQFSKGWGGDLYDAVPNVWNLIPAVGTGCRYKDLENLATDNLNSDED